MRINNDEEAQKPLASLRLLLRGPFLELSRGLLDKKFFNLIDEVDLVVFKAVAWVLLVLIVHRDEVNQKANLPTPPRTVCMVVALHPPLHFRSRKC